MEKTTQKEFASLFNEAKEQLHNNPTAEQIVVIKTANDNMYYFVNNLSVKGTADEDCFIEMLLDKDNVEIKYIVCMWNDYGIEIPSMNFRKRLLEICEKNAEALMLLQGENGFFAKEIKWSMPL